MAFYDKLALYYDDLFPAEKSIESFLREEFEGRKTLVDIACGTGTYALLLAEEGRRILGVDLDAGMIALAKEKAGKRSFPGTVEFLRGDMTNLRDLPGRKYEGLSCLGNSLVHLEGEAEIGKALAEFAVVLAPGGRLVLQIVNFDRILSKSIGELPPLKGEGAELKRRYRFAEDGVHIVFKTELILKDSSGKPAEAERNEVPLFPLKSGRLVEIAGERGFKNIRLFGSYDRSPHGAEESFLTLLTAELNPSGPSIP